jgi:hypothetical protein
MAREKITVRLQQPVLHKRLAPYWCDTCMKLVTMISIEEAAMISRMSAKAIYGKIENRYFHFMQTSSGTHFVCLSSLTSK